MICNTSLFQAVRVIDVVFLGPVMIKGGKALGGISGTFLMLAGIATIVFNGATFFDIEQGK